MEQNSFIAKLMSTKSGFCIVSANQQVSKREELCVKREGFNKGGLEGWKARGIAEKLKSLRVEELKSCNNERSSIMNSSPLHRFISSTKAIAFTMAEILLSLTIIGVVAAITLPSLTGNINERTWNTQRKALYSRFSQAISLMPALNGYGVIEENDPNKVAETFITNGLSKVLKINNICSYDKIEDCGLPNKITPMDGTAKMDWPATLGDLGPRMAGSFSTAVARMSVIDTKIAAFETANGESVVVYYNPRCVGSLKETAAGAGGMFISPKLCANFVYDLNGKKGPNTVGKDIGFITAVYPSDVHVVSPIYGTVLATQHKIVEPSGISASQACVNADSEYRLPNSEEAISIVVNYKFISTEKLTGKRFWSSTPVIFGTNSYWAGETSASTLDDYNSGSEKDIVCVKR